MPGDSLHERIRDHFSGQSTRADIWAIFDTFLNTQEFLNLGYSRWYQLHFLGSSQHRLARKIGSDLTARLQTTHGTRLLDIGCGRGGPTIYFADNLGFNATGIDLVPYNIAIARENATKRNVPAEFVVGNVTSLPFKSDSFQVCTALDSIVYVPAKRAVFAEMARVLQAAGLVAVSDLVMREELDETGITAVNDFAESWDMPPLISLGQYQKAMERAGFTELEIQDISSHSIARLRKWTTLYLRLAEGDIGDMMAALLTRRRLDPATITDQVSRAHEALPYLCHVNIYARNGW